jgi:osmoprotectant transport system permease protein
LKREFARTWRSFLRRNAVTLVLSVVGLASITFDWLTHRPNRLAEGEAMALWSFAGAGCPLVLGFLWFTCVAIGTSTSERLRAVVRGIISAVILIVGLGITGYGASSLRDDPGSAARVSLSAGFWTTFLAAYMQVFASRRRLSGSRWLRSLVTWLAPAGAAVLLLSGWLSDLSLMQEFSAQSGRFRQELAGHFYLFGVSVGMGTLIGIPLGILATRRRWAEKVIFSVTNTTQTIPALALFGLLMAPLAALINAFPSLRQAGIRSIGATPAIIALTAYSLLPIVRNTHASIRQIEADLLEVSRGMGMTPLEVFLRVELPLSAPLIVDGVRTAAVQTVGNAVLAALIGAGGLGFFVFKGLSETAPDLILLGVLPTIALALLVDGILRLFLKMVTPAGLNQEE